LKKLKKTNWEERTQRAIREAKREWPAFEKYLDVPKDQRAMKVNNFDERATLHLTYAVYTEKTQTRYTAAQIELHAYFKANPVKFLFLKNTNRKKI